MCRGAADAARRTGTEVRLICTALRSHDPADNRRLADTAARFRPDGLTGFDLAGPEAAFPDPARPRRRVRGGPCRAGSGSPSTRASGAARPRSAGPSTLDPERIAHGSVAIDDAELCAELRARGVTLDLCPTSNVQAAIVPSVEAHPLARLHRLGVPVSLSTDDQTVSDIELSEEYVRAVERIGLTLPELWAIDRGALAVAFAEPDVLRPPRGGVRRLGLRDPGAVSARLNRASGRPRGGSGGE